MALVSEARKVLQKLTDTYEKHKGDKKFMGNEKQACQSLIVPLVRDMLNWDTDDPAEFKTEIGDRGKRLDYATYHEGIPQFIIEAKAPYHDIFDDPTYYTQAVSYAQGKEKDFAILTNFRQVVILRCDVQVSNILQAGIFKVDVLNEPEKAIEKLLYFEKNYWIEKGKDNELYTKLASYKKRIPVDKGLLADMTNWRQLLLRNIRKNAKGIDFDNEEDLMHVEEEIQMIINRLIFICFCEDKELQEAKLRSMLLDKKDRFWNKPSHLLSKLKDLFREYWGIYDSDLFEKSDCDSYPIDDGELVKVLEDLRIPKDRIPYDFRSIDIDIIGRAYEQFLGHLMTGKKRFKEKQDIAKRKKGGIYYTPKYIVDYIVNNTVRLYVKGKTFEEILDVKILDPACGSGSFLLRVFDVLVDACSSKLKRDLTYEEKKKIMLNCIHGVDLDERAVAITKLTLALKLAERGKKLPMFVNNILVGNSLIDDAGIAGYKAFVWEDEFAEIMKKDGFDVVIGNPPYVSAISIQQKDKEYYKKNFISAKGRLDTYGLFTEKALKLCKNGGLLSFIIPNKFLTNIHFEELRRYILENAKIVRIARIQDFVFESAAVNNVIIILERQKIISSKNIANIQRLTNFSTEDITQIDQSNYAKKEGYVFFLEYSKKSESISEKINDNSVKLEEISDVRDGIVAGRCKDLLFLEKKERESCKKILFGDDMGRYILNWKGRYVDYRPEFMKKQEEIRVKGKRLGIWLRTPEIFETKKIITRKTADKIIAAYDENGFYFEQTVHGTIIKNKEFEIKYILGLLNSRLYEYYYKKNISQTETIFPQVRIEFLKKLPIKMVSISEQQPIIKLVDKMLSLNKRLNEIGDKQTAERKKIEKEIKKTDKEIDDLVYELYGITDEERKVIEEALGR